MISKIRNIIVGALSLAVLAAVPAVVSSPAYAENTDIQNKICDGASTLQIGGNGTCQSNTGDATGKVNSMITTVVNIFSAIVGIIAVIMIVYGGLRYITSGGESGKVTAAKNTIIYAIIGLIVVALAQFIVKFVLDKATQP
jgi:hypothetical protein